jgi:hypothetical protein
MYTKVEFRELVFEILFELGAEFGIEFKRPSIETHDNYPKGQWFYDDSGSNLSVKIWRNGHDSQIFVDGPRLNEDQGAFEASLRAGIREAVELLREVRTLTK